MKPSPDRARQKALQTGQLAETLVAQWLRLQGWTILHQRWHCLYGELDIVAALPDTLAFVEVKARSKGNWDANGLLSVTPQKQAKLWQTAQLFLADYPPLANCSCRFDIALLSCKPVCSSARRSDSQLVLPLAIEIGQPVIFNGYELTLQQYVINAFSEL